MGAGYKIGNFYKVDSNPWTQRGVGDEGPLPRDIKDLNVELRMDYFDVALGCRVDAILNTQTGEKTILRVYSAKRQEPIQPSGLERTLEGVVPAPQSTLYEPQHI